MENASVRQRTLSLMGGLFIGATLVILGAGDAAAFEHRCHPSDPDSDGDGLPDSCDAAPSHPDWDGDGFEDSLELFVGTDPFGRCSFPSDMNGDWEVNVLDTFLMFPAWLETADSPNYRAWMDLNADESVNILDVYVMFPDWLESCYTPWFSLSTVTPRLESGTIHFPKAQMWFSNVGNVYVDNEALDFTTCDEVKQATGHWSNLTGFHFPIGPTGNCNTTSDVRVFFTGVSRDPEFVAQVVPYDATASECTDADPCDFAHYADIVLNRNHSRLTGEQIYRHTVFVHELGHVVGQGHTPFFPACQSEPYYTIMGIPPDCLVDMYHIHWVRPNDVLFANLKY